MDTVNVCLKQRSEERGASFIKKLFGKRKNLKHLILLFVGIVLVVISLGRGASSDDTSSTSGDAEALESILSEVEGVGRCRVLISYEEAGGGYYSGSKERRVYAVIVVCRGAKSAKVESRVRDAVSSLYGIGYNRVTVLEMN